MAKKIKLTERQVLMIRDLELKESNAMSPANNLKRTLTKSVSKMTDKLKIEDEDLLGHPIAGNGGNEYNPQTLKQNKKTFKSFNESVESVSKRDLGYMVKDVVKLMMLKQKYNDHPIFNVIKLVPGQLLKFLNDKLLINDGEGVKVSKVRFKPTVDELYDRFTVTNIQTEERYESGVFSSTEPEMYSPKDIIFMRNKNDGKEYRLIFVKSELSKNNKRINIFKTEDGTYLDDFNLPGHWEILKKNGSEIQEDGGYPAGADNDSNAPWNQPDAPSDPEEDFIVPDKYDLNMIYYNHNNDGLAIFKKGNNLVAHINANANGEEMEDYCSDPSADNPECVNNFVNDLYNNGRINIGIDPINDMLGYITPRNKKELLNYYGSDKKLVNILNGIGETTTAGASSGSFTTKLEIQENIKKLTMFSEEEGIESKKMEDLDGEDNVDENTTTSSVGGQYVTTKVWAKSKKDMKFKKPIYPGGQIVENNLTDTAYPNGEFVEFDDCVKLNNNKKSQDGKCSQGAADGVVKTKKTKNSVVSKEALYYEVAKRTRRPLSEVKKILKNQ